MMSVNLSGNIFVYLPQFEIIPNMFDNTASNKSTIYEIGANFIEKKLF